MTRSHRKSRLPPFRAENIFRKSHQRNFGCWLSCLSNRQKCALGVIYPPLGRGRVKSSCHTVLTVYWYGKYYYMWIYLNLFSNAATKRGVKQLFRQRVSTCYRYLRHTVFTMSTHVNCHINRNFQSIIRWRGFMVTYHQLIRPPGSCRHPSSNPDEITPAEKEHILWLRIFRQRVPTCYRYLRHTVSTVSTHGSYRINQTFRSYIGRCHCNSPSTTLPRCCWRWRTSSSDKIM